MFELKQISPEGIPGALAKAERYRLLNEPELSESICQDVLAVEPDNQAALVALVLALSDQFRAGHAGPFLEAQALLPRLRGEYEQSYYAGLLWERRASARLGQGGPGSDRIAYTWLCKAMEFYEQAEARRPASNDEALLRWNTCVRLLQRHNLHPEGEVTFEPALED